MQARTILKWSAVGAVILLVAACAVVYTAWARGRYLGEPADGRPLALVGGRVYDPAGDSIIADAVVVIEGRRIAAVDPFARLPDSVRVLDVTGLTLLPGLIDSHVHLSGIPTRLSDGSRELGWLSYLWTFLRQFPDRRQTLIERGVTSVVSLGDPHPWIVNFADRIEQHQLAGPRVFVSGPYLTVSGGHPVERFRRTGQGDTSFIAQVARQLVGPAEAAATVKLLSRNVDFVSIVLETRGDPQLPRLPAPVVRSLVSAAHGEDLRARVHVSAVAELAVAIDTGADGIEHVPFDAELDSSAVAALVESRAVVDPTLQALEGWLSGYRGDTAAARRARRNTARLAQAGVPLVAGSDAPSPGTGFGFTLHEELRNLVESGYTPGQAIAAATLVAADHLGLAGRLGSIAPGKWADIIAVGGDPLTTIESLSDIYLVIADGRTLYERLDEVKRPGRVIAMRAAATKVRGGSGPEMDASLSNLDPVPSGGR
ncbi:MAG: amidohydrolase family protein [Gemmatimonadetes bacterium]|nr:amidohydrolase family protein [Gemmatimonadota bacterium]